MDIPRLLIEAKGNFMSEYTDSRDEERTLGILTPFLEKWRLKKVSKWIKGKEILDCGCRTGRLLTLIPSEIAYTGIDKNKKFIMEAKELEMSYQSKFNVLDIEKEVLPDKKYDTIVMAAVIEHLENPSRVLPLLKRYLNNEGRIIITSPTKRARHILSAGSKFRLFSPADFSEHRNYFSKSDFVELMDTASLKIIHYETFEFGLNRLIVAENRH